MWFKASAPGSLMILGEYAVLAGAPAIVAAINQRISVQIIPNATRTIEIKSNLGSYQTELNNVSIHAPFEFVLTGLKIYQTQLPSGCTCIIENEFSHQMGLGSSAAVTVALLAAIYQWLGLPLCKDTLLKDAKKVIQLVQTKGSGSDAAASIFGGVIAYTIQNTIQSLADTLPLTIVFSGFKTPTPQAIALNKKINGDALITWQQQMGELSVQGQTFIQQKNWVELGKLFNQAQLLLVNLGVSNEALDKIVSELEQAPTIDGAKISGAGYGDCVIGLGETTHAQQLPITIQAQGVCWHER